MPREKRELMVYKGTVKGPLLVVIAGIHGNERAGIEATRLVSKMLEVEPITNPSFSFRGNMVGFIGNIAASEKEVRYIDQDLNRMWSPELIGQIEQKKEKDRNSEEHELLAMVSLINKTISEYEASSIYILDLHTTSSDGGIFAIPNYDDESLRVAKNLHAPVVLDLLKGISGTTLHYFDQHTFEKVQTTSITFEAGQHEDPASVNRCIAAIVNCLRSIGCVQQKDVENIHDKVLKSYSKNLPSVTKLLYKHNINAEDNFEMLPGFKNFDPVRKGEVLAFDRSGEISSEYDGLILMPLYQKQGEDGFYIVEKVHSS